MIRLLAGLMLVVLLTGCAGNVAAPMAPAPVVCQVPAGLLADEAAPVAPTGDYTQRDVALYITALHQWAWRAWVKVRVVNNWVSKHCG